MKIWSICLFMVLGVEIGVSNGLAQTAISPEMKSVVSGNSAFALDLFAKLKETSDANLFFSPFSVSAALAMTYAGASGDTAEQMAQVLHLPLQGEKLHTAFADVATDLQDVEDRDKIDIRIANSLWPQKDYDFRKDYLDLLRLDYDATIVPVDYRSELKATRLQLNKWISEKTENKITTLVLPEYLDRQTRLVLINAIYFKGKWTSQFKKNSTKNEPFQIAGGTTVQAAMMTQEQKFGYGEFDELQVLELPYGKSEFSMIVLLPKKVDGLAELETALTTENLKKWIGKLQKAPVRVSLPRFKLTSQTDLVPMLKTLGMTDAFDGGKADFSGMDGKKNSLFISAVLHKAYVDVNEDGTEATAATAVLMTKDGIMVPTFRADHPFLFLIRGNRTGSIAFVGRVCDPTR